MRNTTAPKIIASTAPTSVRGVRVDNRQGGLCPIRARQCKMVDSTHCVSTMQIQTHTLPERMGVTGGGSSTPPPVESDLVPLPVAVTAGHRCICCCAFPQQCVLICASLLVMAPCRSFFAMLGTKALDGEAAPCRKELQDRRRSRNSRFKATKFGGTISSTRKFWLTSFAILEEMARNVRFQASFCRFAVHPRTHGVA